MKFRFAAILAAALFVAAPQVVQAQHMEINAIIADIGGVKFMRDAERAHSAAGLRVIRLSSLAAAERSAGRLYAAVDRHRRAIRFLWGNLAINPMAMTAIRNEGVALEQIVSLQVAGDGGGVLYANDL
ncbi:hypothetical protein PRN20_19255 [Devosia sp. ZB163]|uniref:hypothetical protein n=1 Tax=Devosia sp. ZB163 TaxID=3025938 RepID=UPI002361FC0E|nr:hypothetical protein [Devosia sp. ZB163]MDC9825878.1 hypothetical protein [Devosia sp. ZB163]